MSSVEEELVDLQDAIEHIDDLIYEYDTGKRDAEDVLEDIKKFLDTLDT